MIDPPGLSAAFEIRTRTSVDLFASMTGAGSSVSFRTDAGAPRTLCVHARMVDGMGAEAISQCL